MWYTDDQLRSIPALADADPSDVPGIAEAAGALYARIAQTPGIGDADLRAWAEGAGIPPERYNAAAAVLRETGKAVRLAPGSVAPTASEGGQSAAARVLLEALTAADLQKAAARLKADVAKSAPKEELAAAVVLAALSA